MKIAVLLTSLLLAAGGYLVVRYGSAQVLRESAARILVWEESQGESRFITRADVEGFPKAARFYISSICFDEGGPRFGPRSCYKQSAAWMRDIARQHEERRELGFALLGAGALLGASAWSVARRQRRLAALLNPVG